MLQATGWVWRDLATNSYHDKEEMTYTLSNLAFQYTLTPSLFLYDLFVLLIFSYPRLLFNLTLLKVFVRIKYFVIFILFLILLCMGFNGLATELFDKLGLFDGVKFMPHTRAH